MNISGHRVRLKNGMNILTTIDAGGTTILEAPKEGEDSFIVKGHADDSGTSTRYLAG